MLLLLMRHGIAEDRETWTKADALRPLTPQGKKKTRAVVEGLKMVLEQIDLIATSPLVRAEQTAALVGEAFPRARRETWEELAEAEYVPLNKRLQSVQAETVLLIGHEPGFSLFASQLLTGRSGGLDLEFKKAGICALTVDWGQKPPRAVLQWHVSPKILRR